MENRNGLIVDACLTQADGHAERIAALHMRGQCAEAALGVAVDRHVVEAEFADRNEYPLPALLLLDLKMPRTDGFEVLRWIRQERAFDALRVLVLTSSEASQDVALAYQLGANSFLAKPSDFSDFVQLTRFIDGFWLQFNRTLQSPEPSPNASAFRSPQQSPRQSAQG